MFNRKQGSHPCIFFNVCCYKLGLLPDGSYLYASNNFFPIWDSKVVCPKAILRVLSSVNLQRYFSSATFVQAWTLVNFWLSSVREETLQVHLLETFGLFCLVLMKMAVWMDILGLIISPQIKASWLKWERWKGLLRTPQTSVSTGKEWSLVGENVWAWCVGTSQDQMEVLLVYGLLAWLPWSRF